MRSLMSKTRRPVTSAQRSNSQVKAQATPRPRQSSSPQLVERTRQLMEQAIEFVFSPEFEAIAAEQRTLSLETVSQGCESEPTSTATIAFAPGLIHQRLLTGDEERRCFQKLNFLKWRAEQGRRRLDLRRLDETLVGEIETDLSDALQIRNFIVQGNLRLVVALAKTLAGSLDQMSDLIGEGMAPLIRSVELFDINLGYRFSTYATWAVRNQMLRWLKRVKSSPERLLGEDAPSLENLPDSRPQSEFAEVIPQLRLNAVDRLLASLSERERLIVAARFGLEGQPRGQSLADIAGQLGLSKERVRQIVLGSLSKLRAGMSFEEFEAMN